MKINKKLKKQDKNLDDNINKDMKRRENKLNKTALQNNEEIRKISLPIRKNNLGSPKSKKLMINKTNSFQSNVKNTNNDNYNFTFGKINPSKKCFNIYSDRNKEISFINKKSKNKFLTEKNFNIENISVNILSNKKIKKKNIIPKPKCNIKKCYYSFINLDMEKIDSPIKNDDIFNKKKLLNIIINL